ncbi:hypothetical protein C900_05848 [Fulvivirga imtechensis AK7]|uniref:Uncharacterized protein n=1 Tax=Fulvivirga imtechensis AK7 TaxID=1237149 RepID=L8JN27_9BACT|nr:hypothetical protein C900_05848 [Fulvivirga imtechensis AK7]
MINELCTLTPDINVKPLRYPLFIYLILFSALVCAQGTKIDSLSKVLKTADTDTARIDILNELAFSYIHVDPLVARDDLDIALKASREISYRKGEAHALNVLGGVQWSLGSYEKALENYLESLSIYEALGDKLEIAMLFNNIGEIHKKLGDNQKSLRYLRKATKGLEKYGYPTLGYSNLGEIHFTLHNYDSALYYFKKALRANRAEKNQKYEGYAYHGIGEVELIRKNYREALKSANTALEIRSANKDFRGVCYTYLLLGNIYDAMGKPDTAQSFFDRSLALATQISANDIRINIYKNKAEAFAHSGDHESAYQYHRRYAQLKDSLFNEEKSKQIATLQTSFETELLKKEYEASENKLKQRNTVIIAIVMLFILSAAVAGAFYKQRKLQQGVNKLLALKNEKIQAQTEEIQAQAEKLMKLNQNLESLNATLENKVKSRTKMLKDQNKLLAAYAYSNAHELRAPVASVMGLIDLLQRSGMADGEREIVEHLIKSAGELDIVIRNIRRKLESNGDIIFDD